MDLDDILDVLKAYHFGVITKKDALEALEGTSSLELLMAEVELVAGGFRGSDIKKISKLYVDLVRGGSDRLLRELDEDHPILVYIKEHKILECNLIRLDMLASSLKKGMIGPDLKNVDTILRNLDQLNIHSLREENVLFPAIEERMTGEFATRLRILIREHSDVRCMLDNLKELFQDPDKNRKDIVEEIHCLVYTLNHHKFIEDDMLYPLAARQIDDWDLFKDRSDDIGYCEFLPLP